MFQKTHYVALITCLLYFAAITPTRADTTRFTKSASYTTIPSSKTTKSIYQIGVYYYPGWKDYQYGAAYALPWNQIAPYAERKPLVGYYPEGDVSVAEKTIQQMHDYGINYVVYDWYWDGQKTFLDHAIKAHFAANNKNLENIEISPKKELSYAPTR